MLTFYGKTFSSRLLVGTARDVGRHGERRLN